MTARGWWMLALAGASILSIVALGLGVGIGPRFAIGVGILIAYFVLWALVHRPEEEGTPRAVTLLLITILVAGALNAIDSPLAFFQAFAFPAIWTLLATTSRSIVASTALAATEVVGFVVRLGPSTGTIFLAISIEAISLVFAVAMGIWITRIAEYGNERARLLTELTDAQAQLEMLHRDAGATAERERLARELHDTIAQSLTGQVLLTQRARRELASGALTDATLELLEDASRETLAETRSLVAASARVELPGGGLADALIQLGSRFERESGIVVTVTSMLDESPGSTLSRDAEVVLLRCAQEGLANVRKHAAAAHVRLELNVDEGAATVRVVDDGRGFDVASTASAGFGLSGLRDRLDLVGGELAIDGTPGSTSLTARLPVGVGA